MIEIDNKKYRLREGHLKQALELGFEGKNSSSYHIQISYKNQLYLYAWPETCQVVKMHQTSNENQQFCTQLKLDKDSYIRQNISEYISCYGGAILNNEIHFIVAKHQQKQEGSPKTLEIVKINISTGVYSGVATTGQQPIVRNQPLFESLNNMYLVMYGGFNASQNKICSDAYALIFKQWIKLKVISPLEPRHKFAYTVINGRIYLHGGQTIKNDKKIYFDDFYVVSFSDTKKQLIFQQIHRTTEYSPTGRSGHKLTAVSSRYLLMFGGSGVANGFQEKMKFLHDFWLFDTLQKTWDLVSVHGFAKYHHRSLYGLSFHSKDLYIFGGFEVGGSQRIIDLVKIEFSEQTDKKHHTSLVNQQISQIKGKDNYEGSSVEVATSMIHTSSYLIRSPFQAMQRIIQFAQDQGAQNLRIHSESTFNTIEKFIYISIDFDLKRKKQFNNDIQAEVQKLFVYCLRMGKTAVLVQNNREKHERKVYLMSADGRFSPLLERLQLFYSYSQVDPPHELPQIKNAHHKEIIHKILQGLIQNPQQMIQSVQGCRVLIFTPNIFPTQKSYFYQLVFDSPNDIGVFKNNKKLEFLDKIKYDLWTSMQFSLHSYLKYAHSRKPENNVTKTQVFLSKSPNPIPQNQSYAQYLEQFFNLNQLIKLNIPSAAIKFVDSFTLFACEEDFYLPQNNGILLYQNGRLVNRYECEFGKLLLNKFYHKKYHKDPNNIFFVVGQIHLLNELNLINFKTQVQKNNKFMLFQLSLEKSISQALYKIKPSFLTQKGKSKSKEQKFVTNQNKSTNIDPNIAHPLRHFKSNESMHIKRKDEILIDLKEDENYEENPQFSGKKVKMDDPVEEIQKEQSNQTEKNYVQID